jgi:hypothetical protein
MVRARDSRQRTMARVYVLWFTCIHAYLCMSSSIVVLYSSYQGRIIQSSLSLKPPIRSTIMIEFHGGGGPSAALVCSGERTGI